jgi:hypothetical protein
MMEDKPSPPPDRPRFVLVLEGEPGQHTLHALRALLKTLLRRLGLRCVAVRQVKKETE